MKRILIIHHGEGVGGGLIALLGLIEELKVNNKVEVLSIFDSNAVDYIRQAGVNVTLAKTTFYLKFYRLFLHSEASYFNLMDCVRGMKNLITYFLSKYIFARKELQRLPFDYDIVYLNSTFISDWAAAANALGKKVVIHVREPLSMGILGFRRAIIRETIKKYCDKIIAISEDNSDRIGLREKTTVIYDPVVLKDRKGTDQIIPEDGLKYFLYLGGTQRIKGFEQLIKALPFLNSNVRIFFLGGNHALQAGRLKKIILCFLDPYLWRMKSLLQKMQNSAHIINVGMVDNVFGYYTRSLAVISPFWKPHAALPILEAFSAGKPVIVSDVKGMDELVNSSNGLFFENNNFKALASAINAMAELPSEDYQALSEGAAKSYQKLKDNKTTVQYVLNTI